MQQTHFVERVFHDLAPLWAVKGWAARRCLPLELPRAVHSKVAVVDPVRFVSGVREIAEAACLCVVCSHGCYDAGDDRDHVIQ